MSLNIKSLFREKIYKYYFKKFYVWIRVVFLKICKCSKVGFSYFCVILFDDEDFVLKVNEEKVV